MKQISVVFIHWYEQFEQGPLHKANAKTIGRYKDYLLGKVNEDQIKSKRAKGKGKEKEKPKKGSKRKAIHKGGKKVVQKVRSFFKGIFKSDKDTKSSASKSIVKESKESKSKKTSKTQAKDFLELSLSVNSRKRHLSSIKNFYEYLKEYYEDEKKIFQVNPVKTKIHNIRLKDEDISPTKLLTEEDWQALKSGLFRLRERGHG